MISAVFLPERAAEAERERGRVKRPRWLVCLLLRWKTPEGILQPIILLSYKLISISPQTQYKILPPKTSQLHILKHDIIIIIKIVEYV